MEKERLSGHLFAVLVLAMLTAAAIVFASAAYPGLNETSYAASDYGRVSVATGAANLTQSVDVRQTGTTQNSPAGKATIVDHTSTDITAVPQKWIEEAKGELHIAYGHTSHGSQLTTGMAALVGFANGGGLGLALPQDIFAFNSGGSNGALDLREPFAGDVGYYPQWVNETTSYLGSPNPATGRGTNHPEINVVIWSWCGQASSYTEQQMLDQYLLPMSQLEEDYPGITFVYMTGHSDGTGEEGNLHQRNQQIRDYCVKNNKVLYDFYDVELYDPDESYYGDKAVNDNCAYDSDGNGTRDRNWAIDWQNVHTETVDWYACYCAHSQSLNCNRKAYAAWWLWARLAGWDGGIQAGPQKTASTETVTTGETVIYTITVQGVGAPLDATVYLTDEVPAGLSYVPGSMSSTAGTASDDDAPILHWTGVLSPTPVVTVTYAAIVDAAEAQVITNRAEIASPGYEPVTVSASVTTQGPDLTPSTKAAFPSHADLSQQITYTVVVRSSTGPLNDTVLLTDTVPDGLAYLPGTLTSTSGLVSEDAAPTLHWSGVLSPSPVVTITYRVTVNTADSAFISNDAVIVWPGHQAITRTATILANPYLSYLPLILRND